MDKRERLDAQSALVDWFCSQQIIPARSPRHHADRNDPASQ